MRLCFAILFLAWSASAALITENLVCDLQAGVGITQSGGYISVWADQADLLNNDSQTNDAVQSVSALQPQTFTDYDGRPAVKFDTFQDMASGASTNYLSITNSWGQLGTRTYTVYWVGTGPMSQQPVNALKPTNFPTAYLVFNQGSGLPGYVNSGGKATVVPTSFNRAVYAASGSASAVTMARNHWLQTGTALSTASFTNFTIGSLAARRAGLCNRLLLYSVAHTAAQIGQNVQALAQEWNVITNFERLVVCRGDSICEGSGQTNLCMWPALLARRYPEINWVGAGQAGIKIGTNIDVSVLFSNDFLRIDPLRTNGFLPTNCTLLVQAGVNDINGDAVSGAVAYERMTNYLNARRQSTNGAWQKIVLATTMAGPDAVIWPAISNMNVLLRTTAPGWWDESVDVGLGSLWEKRMNDTDDTTYWWNTFHPNSAGYAIMADHLQMPFNTHRRQTGFW